MKQVYVVVSAMLLSFCSLSFCSLAIQAQQTVATDTNVIVPPLVNFSGTLTDTNGRPGTNNVAVTFSLYSEPTGGAALWMETQNVEPDNHGHYTVMLGSTSSSGLPADIFVAGEAHWLGVQVQGQQQEEQPRVLLVSAPYALKAGDAQTLGGLPASAFVLAATPSNSIAMTATPDGATAAPAASVTPATSSDVTTTGGTVNALPLFSTATNIQNSLLTQTGATTINVGGRLNLPATGTATSSAGFSSRPQDFVASAYSSSTAAGVPQTFQWQAQPTGNDTSTPSATLNLLFGSGTSTPAQTGLHIASNGEITFAAGQTFPGTGDGTIRGVTTASGSGLTGGGTTGALTLGLTKECTASQVLQWNGSAWACSSAGTGTITQVTAGTDLTGGGTSGHVTLNLNTAALNSAYAQLGAANTFAPQQVIKGNGGNAILGDPGCGSGFSGIGLTSSTLSGCLNYTMIGKSTGDVYLNSTSTGYIHFRNGNSGSNTYNDLATIDSSGNLTAAGTVVGENPSGTGEGVKGTSANVGVYGAGDGASSISSVLGAAGVWGDTGAPADQGYAGVLGSADDNFAGNFVNNGTDFATLAAENSSSTSGSMVFETFGPTGGAGPTCIIDIDANLTCSGKISDVAPADGGARQVSLYAMQSPENWFEDFGSETLTNGAITVPLDPTFASTVNTSNDYHVFLTPNGECKGLFVSQKSAGSFEVRELGGGKSNVAFDYRIVAKRAGYENQRLEDVTERYQKMREQEEKRRERMQQLRAARAASALPVPPATRTIAPIAPAGSAADLIPLQR
jgi:hypothetical protein